MSIQYRKDTLRTMDSTQNRGSTLRGLSLLQKPSGCQPKMILNASKNKYVEHDSDDDYVDSDCDIYRMPIRTDIRERYISTLLGSKEEQMQPSLKHQNDDDSKQALKELDKLVLTNLMFAVERGVVFIITNSAEGWVHYSGKMYLPKTDIYRANQNKIQTISSRVLFQEKFPNDVKQWKIQTFKLLKKYLNVKTLTNMICIGDGQEEMEACQLLAKDFKKIYLKKIKLQQKPDPQELLKQLKLLDKRFNEIFCTVSNVTIKLAKKAIESFSDQRGRNKSTTVSFSAKSSFYFS